MTATKPYYWPSSSGEPILPADMSDQHLVNALRITWNMRCPDGLCIPGGWIRSEILRWPLPRIVQAMDALLLEAQSRNLDPEQQSIIDHVLTYGTEVLA